VDRNLSHLSRHIQSVWFSVDTMTGHIIQTSTDRSLLYQGLPQKGKWIVISRFLERPQNRCRRNQPIRRRLIKTKIVRPIQIGYDAWSGGRLLGPVAEMAFVQLVCLRLGVQYKFHRHTYIGRTSHLGKIQGGRPPMHTLALKSLVTVCS